MGDFDVEATRALLTQLFGDWKSPSPYTRVPDPFRPNQPAALRIVVPDKANAFLVGVERIPVDDLNPDYPALLVMSFILGESSSARIPDRLRQKDGLSYSAGTVFRPSAIDANSAIATYAIFAPENLGRVRTGFTEEFDRAVKDGFTDAEVAAAKEGVLQERRLGRTEDSRIAGALTTQAFLGRTYATSGAVDAAIGKLTTQDVNAVLRKYLKPGEFAYAFAGTSSNGCRANQRRRTITASGSNATPTASSRRRAWRTSLSNASSSPQAVATTYSMRLPR